MASIESLKKRTLSQQWYDVVVAMFYREIRRRFNDRLGVGWAVFSPLVFIIGFSFARGLRDGGETYGMPTFLFVLVAMILVNLFLTTFSGVSKVIAKTKKLYIFRGVRPIAAIIAVAVFELYITLLVCILSILVLYLLGIGLVISYPLILLLAIFSVWIGAVSLGTLFTLGKSFVPELARLQTIVSRPIFFISGIFFSLQDIPRDYWYVLDWNPLLHLVEWARFAVEPSYSTSGVSLQYPVLVMLFIMAAAISFYKMHWKRAISS